MAVGGRLGLGQHLADFQPALAANDHPGAARIAHGLDGDKAADMTQQTVANEMKTHADVGPKSKQMPSDHLHSYAKQRRVPSSIGSLCPGKCLAETGHSSDTPGDMGQPTGPHTLSFVRSESTNENCHDPTAPQPCLIR